GDAEAAQGEPAQAGPGRGAGRGAGRAAGRDRGGNGRPGALHRRRNAGSGPRRAAGDDPRRTGRGGRSLAGTVRRRVSPQSRRKYSTVVTTRTRLTCGLLWSRSLIVTTPWLALRMPPSREPESCANCWAESRAAAVASAISPGLMSLSLV